MKLMMCVAASAAIFVSACASEPHPWKRPLSLDQASAMADTNLSLIETNDGIQATWFVADSSASGAQYGLIGALVSAAMDGMINAGPADIARQTADQVATVALTDKINQNLSEQMKTVAAAETYKVRFANVSMRQALTTPKAPDDAVEVYVVYKLSEDATTLQVTGTAAYQRADAKYVTPYTFKSVPEDELSGPLYRNVFVYESSHLPVPTLTPELKKAWSADIDKRIMDQYGALPSKKGDKGYIQWRDQHEEARNNTLTKSEIAGVLAKTWTANDGALVFTELQAAHAFIGKYLLADLNNPTVPRLDGKDETIEQLPSGRVVILAGSGSGAGGYVSFPGNVTTVTSYGNGAETAKVFLDRASAIAEAAKKQATK